MSENNEKSTKEEEPVTEATEETPTEATVDAPAEDNAEAKTEGNAEEANTEEAAAEEPTTEEEASTEPAESASEESEDPHAHIPDFSAGDTLRLGVRITEGDKVRIQYFEGIVLARKGAGVNKTFTIRKIGAGGVAVERIFPLYSPALASFEVRRRGVTRRAKIYFLRDIVGSTANVIKERKIVRDRSQSKAAKSAKKAARQAKRTEVAATKSTVDKKSTTRSARRSNKKDS